MFAAAFVFAAAGAGLVVGAGASRHMIILGFLGLIALGYGRIGYDLLTSKPLIPSIFKH